MFLNAIEPTREILNYELLWASLKNSSLKKVNLSTPTLGFYDKEEEVKKYISTLKKDFFIITPESYQFPKKLRDAGIKMLYYRGDIGLAEAPKKISIVGSRKPTENGIKRARRMAKELTERGFVIVSGLAAGIDTAAMEETTKHKGHLIGVIGTPLNKAYPKENINLQEYVAKQHLLISHVPFYKYTHQPFETQRLYFPERNSIMAGISDATVIVEAGETSGTLTQARECIRMGRPLFILSSCFENGLKWAYNYEKRGAIRVKSIEDILDVFANKG